MINIFNRIRVIVTDKIALMYERIDTFFFTKGKKVSISDFMNFPIILIYKGKNIFQKNIL